mmetsp:Transcript_21354/g.32406  ORF Transcript_21354/g.32406 Transcript_21354/m.32406 type:complete len:317 (+) Transcript_21354:46-996(+)
MAQVLTPEQLRAVFEQTLSPHREIRKQAEDQLTRAKQCSGHALTVLNLVATAGASDAAIRQAAAVHFKNLVKKGWDQNAEDGNDGITISDQDRKTIKDHLVDLMSSVPPNIQAQCSASISLIAAVDFPAKWENLLPMLVQKFNSQDPSVVNGVLLTAHSIFERFCFVQRNDKLYADIIYCLTHIQAPLLGLFKATSTAVDTFQSDALQLTVRFEALRLMCCIFFCLNYQDLPEFFEDHMQEWMAEFAKYLEYQNPLLTDADEEIEPSPIDKLQSAVVEDLNLYAEKDEEPFFAFFARIYQIGLESPLACNFLTKAR